jgi:hypothetical protein
MQAGASDNGTRAEERDKIKEVGIFDELLTA